MAQSKADATNPTEEHEKHAPGLEGVNTDPQATDTEVEFAEEDSVLIVQTRGWRFELHWDGEPADVPLDAQRDKLITHEHSREDSPTAMGEMKINVYVMVEDHGQCISFEPHRESWVGSDAVITEGSRAGGNSEAIR